MITGVNPTQAQQKTSKLSTALDALKVVGQTAGTVMQAMQPSQSTPNPMSNWMQANPPTIDPTLPKVQPIAGMNNIINKGFGSY